MLLPAYFLNVLGMIVLPILLAFYVTRKFSLSWKLILAGGLTFIASQVLHIPFLNWLTILFRNSTLPSLPLAYQTLVYAVVLGLLAGIFEETARWILFKFILKGTKTWEEGVVIGTGYGGAEALILGVLALATVIYMVSTRNTDLSTLIPPEQLELAKQEVTKFWSAPVYMAFMGFIERVFVICLQISLTIMVLYSVAYHKPVWFWIALFWHALVDAFTVYLMPVIDVLGVEAVLGLCAVISLVILFRLRPRFSQHPGGMALPATPGA